MRRTFKGEFLTSLSMDGTQQGVKTQGREAGSGEREVQGQREEVREGKTTCCFYVRSLGEGLTEVYCLP